MWADSCPLTCPAGSFIKLFDDQKRLTRLGASESLVCGVKAVIFHLPQETSHDVLVCDGCFAPLQLSFRKCFGIFCQYHTLLRSLMMVLFLFFCWISAILNMFFRKLWEKAPNNSYQKYPGELFAYFPLRLCTACTITPIISIRKWVGTHPQWIMISMVHNGSIKVFEQSNILL